MKKVVRKGCKVFTLHIINNEQINKEDKPRFEDIPILQDFANVFLEKIPALHMKKDVRKDYKVFVVHIINNEQINKKYKSRFEHIPILQDFADVFSEEIPRLPPKQDLDFTIELIPGVVPNSKDPY